MISSSSILIGIAQLNLFFAALFLPLFQEPKEPIKIKEKDKYDITLDKNNITFYAENEESEININLKK